MLKNILIFLVAANFLSAEPTEKSINKNIDTMGVIRQLLPSRNKVSLNNFVKIARELSKDLTALSDGDKTLDIAINVFFGNIINLIDLDRYIRELRDPAQSQKAQQQQYAALNDTTYFLPSRRLAKNSLLSFHDNVLVAFNEMIFGEIAKKQAEARAAEAKREAEAKKQAATKKEIIEKQINSITELKAIISSDIQSSAKIFIAFDWDNTISKSDGCLLPLREGLKTKSTIGELTSNKNVYPLIVTASSKKILPCQEIFPFSEDLLESRITVVEEFEKPIHKDKWPKCKISFKQFGIGNAIRALFAKRFADTFLAPKLEPPAVAPKLEGCGKTGCNLDRGIVTNARNKGLVVSSMIRENVIKDVPKNSVLVFIDNSRGHLDNVKAAFESNTAPFAKVYIIYYPQNPELTSNPEFEADKNRFSPCTL